MIQEYVLSGLLWLAEAFTVFMLLVAGEALYKDSATLKDGTKVRKSARWLIVFLYLIAILIWRYGK